MQSHDTPKKDYDLERTVFFADGVFAFAMMVIDLPPPEGWDGHFATLLHALAGKVISFLHFLGAAIGLSSMLRIPAKTVGKAEVQHRM